MIHPSDLWSRCTACSRTGNCKHKNTHLAWKFANSAAIPCNPRQSDTTKSCAYPNIIWESLESLARREVWRDSLPVQRSIVIMVAVMMPVPIMLVVPSIVSIPPCVALGPGSFIVQFTSCNWRLPTPRDRACELRDSPHL
jgi:hypothetical protein